MKSKYTFEHDGKCFACGKSTTQGSHESCGIKDIDNPAKMAVTKKRYKEAAKKYNSGRLPGFMYS